MRLAAYVPPAFCVLLIQGCSRPAEAPSVPAGKGVVTGGILRCGAPYQTGHRAGGVTVYRGWQGSGAVRTVASWVAATRVLARTGLEPHETYRFVLRPGKYALATRRPDPSRVPVIDPVTVKSGSTVRVGVGGGCV